MAVPRTTIRSGRFSRMEIRTNSLNAGDISTITAQSKRSDRRACRKTGHARDFVSFVQHRMTLCHRAIGATAALWAFLNSVVFSRVLAVGAFDAPPISFDRR